MNNTTDRAEPLVVVAGSEPAACAATPREELLRQLLDSRIPKNEREWCAAREIEELRKGIAAVLSLIEESYGVAGLHLNGDVAPWTELRTDGRYENWLFDFDQAVYPQGQPEAPSGLAVPTGSAIRCRVWCSPQTHKHPYVWEWAVHNGTDTMEFGREKTEEDAKREAEEARADWQRILSPNVQSEPRAQRENP